MSFKGKVITVTGAASGIGLALTLILVGEGAVVHGSDLNAKGLEDAAKKCELFFLWSLSVGESLSGRFVGSTLDVRKDEDVRNWINAAVEKEGKLDGAANVAGVSGSSEPTNTESIVYPSISN
jgi:NAD(P)-dependent dehydrogenase (short-subunit alcohol dehydrogenase family)